VRKNPNLVQLGDTYRSISSTSTSQYRRSIRIMGYINLLLPHNRLNYIIFVEIWKIFFGPDRAIISPRPVSDSEVPSWVGRESTDPPFNSRLPSISILEPNIIVLRPPNSSTNVMHATFSRQPSIFIIISFFLYNCQCK
jgi:hypothetical protein